jgi:two-component system, sensor histidine kinase and response regulator
MAQSFDEAELVSRVDSDLAFLAETIQMLETDGPALMADIDRALAAADAPALGRAAHALKGVISNFCAAPAQQSALEVERIGKGGNLAQASAATALLELRLQALIAELQTFIHARP